MACGQSPGTPTPARDACEHPELVPEADELSAASAHLNGFLDTPAFILAAPELAEREPLLAKDTMVGPYRIVELIARGGMGDVYRATDVRLRRDVALKVLSIDNQGNLQRVERFVQEARVTAALDHPNIVRVYDVGLDNARPYFVTELLDGETLERACNMARYRWAMGYESRGIWLAGSSPRMRADRCIAI